LLEECKDFSFVLERNIVRRRLWLCHIPLDIHNGFLKELSDLGLLDNIDKQHIKINKDKIEKFYLKE